MPNSHTPLPIKKWLQSIQMVALTRTMVAEKAKQEIEVNIKLRIFSLL